MMFPSDVEAVVVSMWQEVQQNLNYGFGGNGWRRRWSVVTALTASLCQSGLLSVSLYPVCFEFPCCKGVCVLLG
jgi:hypothetical protein